MLKCDFNKAALKIIEIALRHGCSLQRNILVLEGFIFMPPVLKNWS